MTLPYLHRDELTAEGQAVWDAIVESRGKGALDDHDNLAGPFNAFVHAPAVGKNLSELGRVLRFGTSLNPRLVEVVVLTVGARWKAEFEWWAHSRIARSLGISEAVIRAIGSGESPPFDADEERVVHAAAKQLADTGQLPEPIRRDLSDVLSNEGLVELVSLCGYYTLVSFLLNAFSVPLPSGVVPYWGRTDVSAT